MDRQQLQLVLEGSSLPFQIAGLADFRFKTYITAHSYTSQSLATIPLIYISCWFCFSGGILHGTGGLGKCPVPREGKMNQVIESFWYQGTHGIAVSVLRL